MGKRGLTYDEKRSKMMQYFHDTKESFNFKEIEKFSIKLGLPLPTVKDILDSLVADDLVLCEKIGAGNYYWSFPSQAYQGIVNKVEYFKTENSKLEGDTKDLQEKNAEKLKGKESTDERRELDEEILSLKSELEGIQKDLAFFQRNDPKRLQEIKHSIGGLREQANEKTDELFLARKWCLDKCHMDKETFFKQFGVPIELDYLE